MEWNECYGRQNQPTIDQISEFINAESFEKLREYVEKTYRSVPSIEHSICSMKPGWNVKYKKGSRAICALYPDSGYFTCMVSIGSKAAPEAEFVLNGCTEYVRGLYENSKPFNGGRWLMIDVKDEAVLNDAVSLIEVRMKNK